MYKPQIYQIAESNGKNRFGSENPIKSKLFLPVSQCSTTYYAGNVNNNKGTIMTAHAQSLIPWETRPN